MRVLRAVRGLEYLVAGLALGAAGSLAALLVAVGLVLAVAGVGLIVVRAGLLACRAVADVDRRQANRLLGAHVPQPAELARPRRRGWRGTVGLLSRPDVGRVVAFAALRLPVSVGLLLLSLVPLFLCLALVVMGLQGVSGLGGPDFVGPLALGPATGAVLLLLAVPASVVAVAVLGGAGTLARSFVRMLLAPRRAAPGPVRELLAESLGDRSLAIAYWLPERGIYVDDAGHPVELPAPGSKRAWTAVDRDGQRVAAIIHDAGLDTRPELVNAAAAAASLALDNDRLKADLRARVEELRRSRTRIVEAADAARRKLERDLHDGAQQQLVSLSLDVRLLRSRLKDDPEVVALVDEFSQKLNAALAELRELARGIHPAVLTDRGLGPAVDALAGRIPVPVECAVEIDDRLPGSVEAGAYFTIAEALTNVAKYANAESARVEVRREGGDLVVCVEDDGVGGADPSAGSGLRGLSDRIAALEGTLRLESPPGAGTRLTARIPLPAGSNGRGPA